MIKSKLMGTAMLLLLLSGCQLPTTHMINNNFVSIQPETTPPEMVGTWSGSMGPYLVTFAWLKDGEGMFCYSYGTSNVLQKVKYHGHTIFHQDGLQLEVKDMTPNVLVVHAPYFAGQDSTLYRDEKLKNASPFCETSVGKIK